MKLGGFAVKHMKFLQLEGDGASFALFQTLRRKKAPANSCFAVKPESPKLPTCP